MLSHFDIGGRCSGKLILQSRKGPKHVGKYVCNVCDMTIQAETAKRLAARKKTEQMRKRHAAPK